MRFFKRLFDGFTKFEFILWGASSAFILIFSFAFGGVNYLYVIGSLIGATSLIFISKGKVFGQVLTVIFSLFYGLVSYSFRYYGEMITYLCMTAPIAVASVITWLKNPYKKGENEVKVNKLSAKEYLFIILFGVVVGAAFYFILKAFGTENLIVSTISVVTSFTAAALTVYRSPLYAIAYACNDAVLIVLWTLASLRSTEYVSMVVCFVVFLANDVYGFINWTRMRKKQESEK